MLINSSPNEPKRVVKSRTGYISLYFIVIMIGMGVTNLLIINPRPQIPIVLFWQSTTSETASETPTATYTQSTAQTPSTLTITSTWPATLTETSRMSITPMLTPQTSSTLNPSVSPLHTEEITSTIDIPIQGTATLIPLPSITMLYPTITEVDQVLAIKHAPDSTALQKKSSIIKLEKISNYLPIILIFTIWIVLGILFLFYQRRLD